MEEFRKQFERVSRDYKREVLETCTVYSNTTSLKEDIQKATNLGVQLGFSCDQSSCNLRGVIETTKQNPLFKQLGSSLFLADLLAEIESHQDGLNLRNLDYLYIQRTKMPLILLENNSTSENKKYSGVSGLLEVNDLRSSLFKKYGLQQQDSRYLWAMTGTTVWMASAILLGSLPSTVLNFYSNAKKSQ